MFTWVAEPPLDSPRKVLRAYKFFRKELDADLKNGLNAARFLQVILNVFQVVFINLDQKESPYRIFESLNAKGKPLTQGDLIRNYVAMRLPSLTQEKAFTSSWEPLEDLPKESRLVGKIPELTAFVRHYLAMHSGVLCSEGHNPHAVAVTCGQLVRTSQLCGTSTRSTHVFPTATIPV